MIKYNFNSLFQTFPLTDVDGLSVAERELLVAGHLVGRDVLEAVVQQGLHAHGARVGRVEEIVELATRRPG